jgi:hypothetical protein
VGAPGPVPMWPMPKSWPEQKFHHHWEVRSASVITKVLPLAYPDLASLLLICGFYRNQKSSYVFLLLHSFSCFAAFTVISS